MFYLVTVTICVGIAAFLNCFIGEDISVVRVFLSPLVLLVVVGFLVRLPLSRRLLLWRVGIAAVGLALIACMGVHPYLLQLQFNSSRGELTSAAREIASGKEIRYPFSAGTFAILDGGAEADGSIYLWTALDPSGPEGFVFDYTGSGYNTWSEVQLSENCFYICID
jgi:hypothetical protein